MGESRDSRGDWADEPKTSTPTNTIGKSARVIESKRKIVFASGNHLNLRNVTAFNSQGSMLRLWSDEGYVLVNPQNVDYHIATVAGDVVS